MSLPTCNLIGLECGLGFGIFKRSPGDTNVQTSGNHWVRLFCLLGTIFLFLTSEWHALICFRIIIGVGKENGNRATCLSFTIQIKYPLGSFHNYLILKSSQASITIFPLSLHLSHCIVILLSLRDHKGRKPYRSLFSILSI